MTSEVQRVRYELGYNVLAAGAEPYISYVAVFDRVVQAYLNAGAKTTSATAVTAATAPTPVSLTVVSAVGITAGDRIVVDVDTRQEWGTVTLVSGSIVTVPLMLAHSGTYPVTVEGGEAIVRELLLKIRNVKDRMAKSYGSGSLKKADEVEFYERGGRSLFGVLSDDLMYWRDELSGALGVPNLWRMKRGGGGIAVSY
jgi:hypothetical protein